ncbi:MAG TPA: SGNH/GDSL hydrolase family protein [Gemmatimonadaceae bacterium]|nr:SGNH/GDSL hydrolase family protein [Gemmatimonadaceae bacterium]
MPHVVLLGDSIFDNAAYVGGGPDVVTQLRAALPSGWQATLCAVDGATTDDLRPQLSRIPRDATHLVLSVGGNDALAHVDILERPARSAAEVLSVLADIAARFELRYRRAVAALRDRGLPLSICTIYNGRFPDPLTQRLAQTALTVFNDVILRVAIEHALAAIDLRALCADPADYANPIEPSSVGGEKIARAIARVVTGAAEGAARVVGP